MPGLKNLAGKRRGLDEAVCKKGFPTGLNGSQNPPCRAVVQRTAIGGKV